MAPPTLPPFLFVPSSYGNPLITIALPKPVKFCYLPSSFGIYWIFSQKYFYLGMQKSVQCIFLVELDIRYNIIDIYKQGQYQQGNMQINQQQQKCLIPDCLKYYMKGINLTIPDILMRMETSHIMMLFFYIGGLHILEKEEYLEHNNMKEKLIEYVVSLQLKNGGFTCSSLYSGISLSPKFQQSHIVFTYSAVNSLKILGALDKVDKKLILKNIGNHQRVDGSFSSFENSTQCDLRFVYSALSICRIFQDFSFINIEKSKQYIDSCFNFDGGYGLRPNNESHCGAIYCAVASYQHLGVQIPKPKSMKTIHFLVHRQSPHEQELKLIGVQGRVGKYIDSCYSFWAGASLKMLSGKNLLNPEVGKFLMKCYKEDQKCFSKYMENKSGDPVHTFHSITGLKILNEQAQNISLSQILRKQKNDKI